MQSEKSGRHGNATWDWSEDPMALRTSWIFPGCLVATVIVAAMLVYWQVSARRHGRDLPRPAAAMVASPGVGRGPLDPALVFKSLSEKLHLTPEQQAAIGRSIDESRRQGAYPWESVRQAAEHLTQVQRGILDEYREAARAMMEERNRARDLEIARGYRPDQYRRFVERQYDRSRVIAAAAPR